MDETREHEPPKGPSVSEVRSHIEHDLAELREVAERRRDEVLGQARQLVDQHPLAAVGVAFGAGYLLSGALFSRMTARVLVMGARWYVGRALRGALAQATEGVGGFDVGSPSMEGGRS